MDLSISPDPVKIPAVFSKMGCWKQLFNCDNDQKKFIGDWKQILLLSSKLGQLNVNIIILKYYIRV